MNFRVSNLQNRPFPVKLSKALQEKLLDAVANTSAYARVNTEIPEDDTEQSQLDERPFLNGSPLQPTKRKLESDVDLLPAKRPCLTQIDTQQPGINDRTTEQTSIRQPKPGGLQHPYASFLRNFVDPVDPGSHPESVHSFVAEWLDSVGSDREEHSRSDSYLHYIDNGPISRQLTRSTPAMGRRDKDGYAVPESPASTRGRRSDRADADSIVPSEASRDMTGSSRGSARATENAFYRVNNLAWNRISMRYPDESVPDNITTLMDRARQDRASPGPTSDQVFRDRDLFSLTESAESEVQQYFGTHIFTKPSTSDNLKRTDRHPMAGPAVPNVAPKLKVANPIPDMIYGYNYQAIDGILRVGNNDMAANNQKLVCPFFVIEFKGDTGSMWVAENQCLGGSASCVNISEKLNHQLRQCRSEKVQPIDNAAFSIAMNGREASLYISWKQNDLDYYMQRVESFALQKPGDFLEFRKYVRNIIDWGANERLHAIRKSVNDILEESGQRASRAANSRESPFSDSATDTSKKSRSSSGRGRASEPESSSRGRSSRGRSRGRRRSR